jgi:hypothetical protein
MQLIDIRADQRFDYSISQTITWYELIEQIGMGLRELHTITNVQFQLTLNDDDLFTRCGDDDTTIISCDFLAGFCMNRVKDDLDRNPFVLVDLNFPVLPKSVVLLKRLVFSVLVHGNREQTEALLASTTDDDSKIATIMDELVFTQCSYEHINMVRDLNQLMRTLKEHLKNEVVRI